MTGHGSPPGSEAITSPPTSWFPSSSSVSEQLDRYWCPDHSSSPSQISRDWDIPGQPARQRGAQGGDPSSHRNAPEGGEGAILLWGLFWGDTSPLSSITGLVRSESFSSELMEALCCFLDGSKNNKNPSFTSRMIANSTRFCQTGSEIILVAPVVHSCKD